MDSIIRTIQKEALDSSFSVNDLLRKSYLVARKLKLESFQKWIEFELNGYTSNEDIPEYRQIHGNIKGFNPYQGWMQLITPDADLAKTLSTRGYPDSISVAEEQIKGKDSGMFQMLIAPDLQEQLLRGTGCNEIIFYFSGGQLKGIIERVRNIILEWVIKLEEDGILGNEVGFSENEVKKAEATIYNIETYIESVKSSQVQVNSSHSVQTMNKEFDLEKVRELLSLLKKVPELGLKNDDKEELKSDISTMEAQINSPRPKMKIIKEGLKSFRSILQNASGSVVAHQAIEILTILGI